MAAPIIVYPPDEDGARRVRAGPAILGRAHGPQDLLVLLERAGLDPAEVTLDGPLIEWRGGGPYEWEPSTGGATG